MGNQNKTIGVVDKGISCNSRLFLIRPGKPPSMTRTFPLHLIGLSPFLHFTGTWPLTMWAPSGCSPNSSRISSTTASFPEVRSTDSFLQMRLFCLDKIPLKGRHLVFSEQRRIRMLPDAPHDILSLLFFLFIQREKAFSYIAFQCIIQTFPTVAFPQSCTSFKDPSSLSGTQP